MARDTTRDRMRERLESQIRVQDARINELKAALRNSWADTIHALPAMTALALSSSSVKTEEDLATWLGGLTDRILELAEPKPGTDMGDYWYNDDRAYCPLCGGSAAPVFKPANTGFAFPDGLAMHLNGMGNVRQCHVITVARRLAKSRLDPPKWWNA